MRKWIRIPLKRIRITQRVLKSEANENFTDSNPLILDSNPALENHVRDSNPSNSDLNPQGKKSNPTVFQRLVLEHNGIISSPTGITNRPGLNTSRKSEEVYPSNLRDYSSLRSNSIFLLDNIELNFFIN